MLSSWINDRVNNSVFRRFLNSASDEEERIASGKLFQTDVAAAENDLSPEADLGMFSMFGRTGAPTKRGPQKRTWAENNHVITKYSVNVG